MIVDERMVTFINSLDEGHTEFLEQLEKEAREDAVPIVRREMQSFLMCEYNPESCQIITIENYEKRIPIARENFKKAGKEGQIELLEGDAAEILPTLTEPFDFIFMDAAKGQYLHFLPEVLRLLKSGGLLVSDNILQEGDLIESRFAVERRNRTIYKRMREYLYELKHNDELVTSLLPLGDGVAISTKR